MIDPRENGGMPRPEEIADRARVPEAELAALKKIRAEKGEDVYVFARDLLAERLALAAAEIDQLVPRLRRPKLPAWLPPFAHLEPFGNAEEQAVLTPRQGYDNARQFVQRKYFHNGVLTTFFWRGKFWRWADRVWQEVPEEIVRQEVYRFLDLSKKMVVTAKTVQAYDFSPSSRDVNELLDGLRSGICLTPGIEWGTDLLTGERRPNVQVFSNTVANLVEGVELPASPWLWTNAKVDYAWNSEALCPGIEAWQAEVFAGDSVNPETGNPESMDAMEEAIGATVVGDTRFHKGILGIGLEGRNGKGTYAVLMTGLVGSAAMTSVDFNTWFASDYSRESVVGKKAIISMDVRLKPPKQYGANVDPGGMDHKSVELLLKLTADDVVTIPRKYIGPFTGQVGGFCWLFSNEVPNFNDKILIKRFVKILFPNSFEGREDTGLQPRLLMELPGFLQRCLRAYRRALARGALLEPASGQSLRVAMTGAIDPFEKFFHERVELDTEATVVKSVVYDAFTEFCARSGHKRLWDEKFSTSQAFGRRLRKACEAAKVALDETSNSPRKWIGLRLKAF